MTVTALEAILVQWQKSTSPWRCENPTFNLSQQCTASTFSRNVTQRFRIIATGSLFVHHEVSGTRNSRTGWPEIIRFYPDLHHPQSHKIWHHYLLHGACKLDKNTVSKCQENEHTNCGTMAIDALSTFLAGKPKCESTENVGALQLLWPHNA